MPQRDGIVKPKTKRSKRFLQSREAKLIENVKNAMIMKGGNTSETVTQALKDIYSLKKPNAVMYKKKNITRPFEDQTSLEFFSKKADCSLFLFGSHNKKRPNNLIFGRMFDFHVLDMIELGIEKFASLKQIKKNTCPEGTKPLLVFSGEAFNTDNEYKRLQSVLTDFFRGPSVPSVRLAGLEHLLHFTALEGKIYMRSYTYGLLSIYPSVPSSVPSIPYSTGNAGTTKCFMAPDIHISLHVCTNVQPVKNSGIVCMENYPLVSAIVKSRVGFIIKICSF